MTNSNVYALYNDTELQASPIFYQDLYQICKKRMKSLRDIRNWSVYESSLFWNQHDLDHKIKNAGLELRYDEEKYLPWYMVPQLCSAHYWNATSRLKTRKARSKNSIPKHQFLHDQFSSRQCYCICNQKNDLLSRRNNKNISFTLNGCLKRGS